MVETYADMLLNFLSAWIAYMFVCMIHNPVIKINDPIPMVVIFALLFLSSFIYQWAGVYTVAARSNMPTATASILRANFIFYGSLSVMFSITARGDGREFLLTWTLIALFVSTAILMFKRQITVGFVRLLRKKQFHLRKVIIVGDDTEGAADFIKRVTDDSKYGIMILGYVGSKISPSVGCEKLGELRELERVIEEYKPTDAVFAINAYDKRHLIRLVNLCDDKCVRVYFLPVIYGFFKTPRQIEQIGDLPIINIHTTPLDNPANAAVKRAVDIIGSLALIILTSPIMLITAIGVRLSSPGPILFRQKRVGKLGKPFTMLKFRSMRVNTDSDVAWSHEGDPRKTKFGSFIRATSIDELPQLFNVLLGSMSLVGPRPEIPHFVEYFRTVIPLYMVKHYVKPGLTGLAQVRGLRGDTDIEERIHADIEYIENWSLWLDISILLKTPFKAFNKSERVESAGTDENGKEGERPEVEIAAESALAAAAAPKKAKQADKKAEKTAPAEAGIAPEPEKATKSAEAGQTAPEEPEAGTAVTDGTAEKPAEAVAAVEPADSAPTEEIATPEEPEAGTAVTDSTAEKPAEAVATVEPADSAPTEEIAAPAEPAENTENADTTAPGEMKPAIPCPGVQGKCETPPDIFGAENEEAEK